MLVFAIDRQHGTRRGRKLAYRPPAMARSLQAQLDAVDALIAELEAAQGLITNDTAALRLTRERLKNLYQERRDLQADVREETARTQGASKFWTGRGAGNAGGNPF